MLHLDILNWTVLNWVRCWRFHAPHNFHVVRASFKIENPVIILIQFSFCMPVVGGSSNYYKQETCPPKARGVEMHNQKPKTFLAEGDSGYWHRSGLIGCHPSILWRHGVGPQKMVLQNRLLHAGVGEPWDNWSWNMLELYWSKLGWSLRRSQNPIIVVLCLLNCFLWDSLIYATTKMAWATLSPWHPKTVDCLFIFMDNHHLLHWTVSKVCFLRCHPFPSPTLL